MRDILPAAPLIVVHTIKNVQWMVLRFKNVHLNEYVVCEMGRWTLSVQYALRAVYVCARGSMIDEAWTRFELDNRGGRTNETEIDLEF